MNSPAKARRIGRFLPRFSLSLLLCVILFYGLGIVTQWYLEGRRRPEHQDIRIRALQSMIATQDRYIRELYGKKSADLRRAQLELLVARKQLELLEGRIGVKEDAKTRFGTNGDE